MKKMYTKFTRFPASQFLKHSTERPQAEAEIQYSCSDIYAPVKPKINYPRLGCNFLGILICNHFPQSGGLLWGSLPLQYQPKEQQLHRRFSAKPDTKQR